MGGCRKRRTGKAGARRGLWNPGMAFLTGILMCWRRGVEGVGRGCGVCVAGNGQWPSSRENNENPDRCRYSHFLWYPALFLMVSRISDESIVSPLTSPRRRCLAPYTQRCRRAAFVVIVMVTRNEAGVAGIENKIAVNVHRTWDFFYATAAIFRWAMLSCNRTVPFYLLEM